MVIQKTQFVRLALFWGVCSLGCSSSNEEAPLADGLELRYEWGFDGEAVLFNVTVRRDGGDHFLLDIEGDDEEDVTGGGKIRIDRFFKTEKGQLAALAEHPLWLPPSLREPGAKVVPDGSICIRSKERTWKGWNVLVAGGSSVLRTVEWYYEKETGFLVGTHVERMGSNMRLTLVETNVPGLNLASTTAE